MPLWSIKYKLVYNNYNYGAAFSLMSIQKIGNDNASTLPATTFGYDSNYACMTAINNGMGGSKTINYAQFYNTGTRYKVTSETTWDGMGNGIATSYNYPGDGLYQNGEFRGFGYVGMRDAANTITETWFNQDDICKGLPSQTMVRNDSVNFKKTTYNYISANTASAGGYTGAKKCITVASNGSVFATKDVGYGLKWTGTAWDETMGGQVSSMSAKSDSEVWGIAPDTTIWKWTPTTSWKPITGNLQKIAAGSDGAVYGITAGMHIFKWNGTNGWIDFTGANGGALKEISVKNTNEIWGIGGDNDLWCWTSTGKWAWKGTPPGKTLLKVSVGSDGAIYCVDSSNAMVRYNNGWDYSKGGGLKEISVKSASEIWGIGLDDQVWRYTGGSWGTGPVNGSGGGNAYFVALSQQDDYLYDGDATNTHTRTTYDYDTTYGNVTKVSNMGNANAAGDETYTNTEYINDTTNWILGVPKHVYNLGGSTKMAESWNYYSNTYNGTADYGTSTKFLRKTENAYVFTKGNASNPTTQFEYQANGNIVKTIDANGNPTTTTYDGTYNIFPVSVKNAKNQITSYTYYGVNALTTPSGGYGVFGQLQRTQDGNSYSWNKYDAMGRLLATWREKYDEYYPEVIYQYKDWGAAIRPTASRPFGGKALVQTTRGIPSPIPTVWVAPSRNKPLPNRPDI